jgi:hypothetical protein
MSTALTFSAEAVRKASRPLCRYVTVNPENKTIMIGRGGWIDGPCEIGTGWTLVR